MRASGFGREMEFLCLPGSVEPGFFHPLQPADMEVLITNLLLEYGSDIPTLLALLTDLLGSAAEAQAVITEELILN